MFKNKLYYTLLYKYLFFFLLLTSGVIYPQTAITVYNKSDRVIYAAIYKQPVDTLLKATKFTDTVKLEPQAQASLNRVNLSVINKLWYNNLLVFTTNPENLNEELSYNAIKQFGSLKVGPAQGKEFFIFAQPGKELKGYNYIYWKTILPVQQKISQTLIKPTTKAVRSITTQDSNQLNQIATVRIVESFNPELNNEEKEYLQKRASITKQAQEKLLNYSIKEPLNIGFSMSGGGFRAMILTAATLAAAEQAGLLDATTYLAGLSGSTWAMGPFYSSQLSAGQFLALLEEKATQGLPAIAKNILKINTLIKQISSRITSTLAGNKALSLIDIYGYFLGQQLLENSSMFPAGSVSHSQDNITLATQISRVQKADLPFPLYTAALANTATFDKPWHYQWLEFSPYEVLSDFLRGGINSWALGRKFNNGTSINNAPPYTLGYLMGIWGSAPSASLRDAYDQLGVSTSIWGLRHIAQLLVKTELGDTRFSPANIPNYTFNMPTSPFSEKSNITLIDAGISANNPVYPLLNKNRKMDIIIVCDFSNSVTDALQLKRAVDLAEAQGYKMPRINYQEAAQQISSVWSDPDPEVPTIIYLPRIKNPAYNAGFDPETTLGLLGYAQAGNLIYTKKQFADFAGLMHYNLLTSLDKIKEAMKYKLEQKESNPRSTIQGQEEKTLESNLELQQEQLPNT